MNLHVIDTGFFKLDGGAMFGVVPKSIWNKLNPADENNLCTWAMRCLLIEEGQKIILIDTGIGDKQEPGFLKHYHLHGNDSLISSIIKAGFSPDDITDVILTHLHFDHCGGATKYNSTKSFIEPTFKNALYWVHSGHWNSAINPNQREKASFLKENLLPLQESGQLMLCNTPPDFSGVSFLIADGHTEKQLIPLISYKDKTIAFAADLIPSAAHIPVNYIMSYDVRPLDAMQEKEQFLERSVVEEIVLFFEHDPLIQSAIIHKVNGKFAVKELINFSNM